MLSKRTFLNYSIVAIIIAVFCVVKLFVFTCEGDVFKSTCGVNSVNPNTDLIGIKSDDYQYMGFMYLTHQNIAEFKMPFAFNNIFRYPGGFNYEYGFDGAFPVIFGALVAFITNLVFSYNFVIFSILFLNIFVSFIFFDKIARLKNKEANLFVTLIAAFIFGASSYVIARLNSHTNMAVIFGFPVLIYGLVKLIDDFEKNAKNLSRSSLFYIYLGVLLTLAGSIQFMVMIIFVLVLFVGYVIARYRDKFFAWFFKSLLTSKLLLLVSTCIFLAIFLFLFYGYVYGALTMSLNTRYIAQKISNANLTNFFLPNQYIGYWFKDINQMPPTMESAITLGLIPMILFVIAFAQSYNKKSNIYYFLALGFVLIFMFGLIRLTFLPQAGRLVVVLSLIVALYVVSNLRVPNRILIYALLLLVVLEKFSYSTYQNPIELPHYKFIRNLEGTAILNVPLNQYEPKRSILPYFYNKKIMDGYFHFPAINITSAQNFINPYFSRFDCNYLRDGLVDENFKKSDIDEIVKFSKQNDIKYMVVYKNDSVGYINAPGCENVVRWMSYLTPKQMLINSKTDGVIKSDVVFNKNELGSVKLVFNVYGKFYLNDILTYPNQDVDILVETKNGSYNFRNKKAELIDPETNQPMPLVIDITAGDELTLTIKPDDNQTIRYLTLYYAFDGVSVKIDKDDYFQKIYEDQNVDVYKIY